MIDRIVDRQVGANAPASVRQTVRAALESAVADDPLLSEKIKTPRVLILLGRPPH